LAFQETPGEIHWRLHFNSSPEKVYEALATDEGRSRFWAESAEERDGEVEFRFLNEPKVLKGAVLRKDPPHVFSVEYFASKATFTMDPDGAGGTDLSLRAYDVDEQWRMEMAAGWISVLMSMKAAVDFGVDLRNHDPERTWDQGFVDN
jgi:uncharacterized protein YndB with AHSA1/START domain